MKTNNYPPSASVALTKSFSS